MAVSRKPLVVGALYLSFPSSAMNCSDRRSIGDQSADNFTLSRLRSMKINGKMAVRLNMASSETGVVPVAGRALGFNQDDPSRSLWT